MGHSLVQGTHRSLRAPVVADAGYLQRRPDIAAAERRVAAANAQIGVAQAAFFPDLTLSGSVGLEASRFASLLSGPSLFWALVRRSSVTLWAS